MLARRDDLRANDWRIEGFHHRDATLARVAEHQVDHLGQDGPNLFPLVAAGRRRERSERPLLRLHPRTGRTHQLRAHLSYIGLPIAGDLRYGGGQGPGHLKRQFLHAAGLAFQRPSDAQRVETWSALPPDLAASLEAGEISVEGLPATGGFRLAEGQADIGAVS